MRIDHLLPEMRAQLNAALPEKAFLRRDRGDALFISNAPVFDPGICSIPGFRLEMQGRLMRILPDESWIDRLEENDPSDHLSRSLLRFRGKAADTENLKLFARGCKLLDDPAAAVQSDLNDYDRALRQSAAIALRGGCGGALYACALMNAEIIHII
jgi:hypothetical protein